MRKLIVALIAPLCITALPAPAQQAKSAPDSEHQLLASLSGQWVVTQSLWSTPGKPPKIDRGTADLAMILNGRHLRQALRIDDGTNFEGLGYVGYDGTTGKFFSTWMDVNFPGIVIARGSFDAGSKSITLVGTMDQTKDGEPVGVREVLTIMDRDHIRYDFYETRRGVEALGVRLDYTRRR